MCQWSVRLLTSCLRNTNSAAPSTGPTSVPRPPRITTTSTSPDTVQNKQIGRDEHDVLGGERAGEAGERARDRERGGLVPLHRQPERPHARLVRPDADQRAPEARAQQAARPTA